MVAVLEVLPPSRYLRPFLGTGVLGGYTTFSTYELESRDLLVGHHPAEAALYLFGSVFTGLLAVWLGVTLTRAAFGPARREPAAAALLAAPGAAPAADPAAVDAALGGATNGGSDAAVDGGSGAGAPVPEPGPIPAPVGQLEPVVDWAARRSRA